MSQPSTEERSEEELFKIYFPYAGRELPDSEHKQRVLKEFEGTVVSKNMAAKICITLGISAELRDVETGSPMYQLGSPKVPMPQGATMDGLPAEMSLDELGFRFNVLEPPDGVDLSTDAGITAVEEMVKSFAEKAYKQTGIFLQCGWVVPGQGGQSRDASGNLIQVFTVFDIEVNIVVASMRRVCEVEKARAFLLSSPGHATFDGRPPEGGKAPGAVKTVIVTTEMKTESGEYIERVQMASVSEEGGRAAVGRWDMQGTGSGALYGHFSGMLPGRKPRPLPDKENLGGFS